MPVNPLCGLPCELRAGLLVDEAYVAAVVSVDDRRVLACAGHVYAEHRSALERTLVDHSVVTDSQVLWADEDVTVDVVCELTQDSGAVSCGLFAVLDLLILDVRGARQLA